MKAISINEHEVLSFFGRKGQRYVVESALPEEKKHFQFLYDSTGKAKAEEIMKLERKFSFQV